MTTVICVANQKGGVSKTSTALAIVDVLTQLGHKTLFVDTDPQCNSTHAHRASTQDVATLYDILVYRDPVVEAIQHTEMGDVVPCDALLGQADALLGEVQGKEFLLRDSLSTITNDYEFIVIDTPPSMGILLVNALACATGVVIPISTDAFALMGLGQLGETIANVRAELNPELKIFGLLKTQIEERVKLTLAAEDPLLNAAKEMRTIVFKTYIRRGVAVRYAQAEQMPLSAYAPRSTVYQDYKNFVLELCEHILEKEGAYGESAG